MDANAEANGGDKRGWAKLKTLDGASRLYTFSVLTTLALWITTVYFDAEYLHRNEDDDDNDVLLQKATPLHTFSAAWEQIIRALLLLLLCFLIGACSFFLVAINVYPFEKNQVLWQSWSLIAATVSLVVTNALVVFAMYSAQQRFDIEREDPDHYESAFSHVLLIVCLILSVVIMDLSFLATFTENKLDLEEKEKTSHWSIVRHRLSSLARPVAQDVTNRVVQQPSLRSRARDKGVKALRWLGLKALNLIAAIVERIMELLSMKKPDDTRPTNIMILSSFSTDVSDTFVDVAECFVNFPPISLFYKLLSFFTWRAWTPWRHWLSKSRVFPQNPTAIKLIKHRLVTGIDAVVHWIERFPLRNREWIDSWYDAIREDCQFEHSAWVLAAMCTSFVLLFYFGVKISSQVSGYLDEMYTPRRDCTVRSVENNGELGNFIFRLAGFTENSRNSGDAAVKIDDLKLTEAACRLPDLSTDIATGSLPSTDARSLFQDALPRNITVPESDVNANLYRCSTNDFSPNFCLPLLIINELERNISRELNETIEPIEVFKDHSIGRTIYVVDRMLRHIRWTVWVGLIVGLIVGIGSLLYVLAQYKRFSLAIRAGFFNDLHMTKNLAIFEDKDKYVQQIEEIVTEREWAKLIERYPMGSAVFFFGILVSTAVIQLVVFGSTVAMLLSLIVSIFDDRVFAILRPYMALLIAFLITWLINGPIAQRAFCERFLVRKYKVLMELPFLAFLLVYTAVHLVLGVFFALMRLVWVLLTSIACLNRLDRNLFPILKYNDLGHRSFMAMVLMQHAFLSNAEDDEKLPFHILIDRLRQQPPPSAPSSSRPIERPTTSIGPDVAAVVKEALSKKETLTDQAIVDMTIDEETGEQSEVVSSTMTPSRTTTEASRIDMPRRGISADVTREVIESESDRRRSMSSVPHYLRDDFDQ